MSRIADIVLAIIEQTPWIATMFICNTVYRNKPKHTVINIMNKYPQNQIDNSDFARYISEKHISVKVAEQTESIPLL